MRNNFSTQLRQSLLAYKQTNLLHPGFILVILLTIGILSGCVNHKAKNQELLAENYQTLSNDDLILYYYKLKDQIEVVEQKRTGSSISLGLGLGSFGHRSGGSGSVGVTTGGSQRDIATDLRDRRNEVRVELKNRGITP
ncbi:hypothetical protein [uncultured Desulfuromusa sp.]|uniref:hypothetical protein n=1 Tax=uncultured Desulfuromusa sp. TaxID=219183 RepID=UPI002AA7848D|nr:hypothetical protein [uncultured Desulfuromusa sp.]